MTRWTMIFGLLSIPFAAFAAACSDGNTGGSGSCSATISASCPSTAPSYAADVAPLIATYCGSCHAAGGQEADKPLDTYAALSALSGQAESQMASCAMPPSGSSQPTAAELQTILDWFVCGAQNN